MSLPVTLVVMMAAALGGGVVHAAEAARPAAAAPSAGAHAVVVRDDTGRGVRLAAPARRVVTLSPHATELMVAAGAGDRLVGVDQNSDYPPDVKRLAQVGNPLNLDIERVLALKPDLIVAWDYAASGSTAGKLPMALLDSLGIAVFYSRPAAMADIPDTLDRFGRLAGTGTVAAPRAAQLRQQLHALTATYAGQAPVRTFYQLSGQPLYTLNNRGIIGDALRLCGADNVFGALPAAAPMVSVEGVLLANPQVIVVGASTGSGNTRGAGNAADAGQSALAQWKPFAPGLTAAARGHLFVVDADRMHRPGPRMIDETRTLCEHIDQARKGQ
jgi:ABC-type Fe3+-hydroxamate transport system substrate-binding protein